MLDNLARSDNGIEEGATYRCPSGGRVSETARVLGVAEDKMGIPHVRFQLRVARGLETRTEQRTLALDSFYQRYRERV
ncbi:MAG TPA: hypothetical protein VMV79_05020 [Alphaproteobacteria bacterium]|nr:hypothetical protein [Alphaproteobacteria bacterium]